MNPALESRETATMIEIAIEGICDSFSNEP